MTMQKSSSLKFCYKGDRDYIQGPDIYNEINKFIINDLKIQNIRQIDISIHKIIKNCLNLEVYKNKTVDKRDDTAVVFSFVHNSDRYILLLSENDKKVDCRYEYPEEEIVKRCRVFSDKQMIILESRTDFSDIEIFTAMNKALLKSIYPDVNGKWLLTRFETDKYRYCSQYHFVLIELKHNFNFRLTKSIVNINNNQQGIIYFSLI